MMMLSFVAPNAAPNRHAALGPAGAQACHQRAAARQRAQEGPWDALIARQQ